MAFAEDLTVLFDTVNGFAETVSIAGKDVDAIFDAAFIEDRLGTVGLESSKPACIVQSADIPDIAHGDEVVRGTVTYKVVAPISPDGQGITLLHLEKQ